MKKRRNIIAALTLFTALSLTACAGNSTGESNNTQQSSASVTEADESTDDLQAQLTALYEQEQKIFDGHKDTWDKVFEVMDITRTIYLPKNWICLQKILKQYEALRKT